MIPIDSDEPDTVLCFHYMTGGWTIFKGWNACVFLEQAFEGKTRLLMGCDERRGARMARLPQRG